MPDFTGDLGNKLTAAVHDALDALPGIEVPLLQAIKDTTASVIAAESAGISQAGAQLLKVEEPVLEQWKATNENIATLIGLLQSIKDDGIPVSGMLFGGKK